MDPIALNVSKLLEQPVRSIDDSLALEHAILVATADASPQVVDIVDDLVEALGQFSPGFDAPGLLSDAEWETAKTSALGRLRTA